MQILSWCAKLYLFYASFLVILHVRLIVGKERFIPAPCLASDASGLAVARSRCKSLRQCEGFNLRSA